MLSAKGRFFTKAIPVHTGTVLVSKLDAFNVLCFSHNGNRITNGANLHCSAVLQSDGVENLAKNMHEIDGTKSCTACGLQNVASRANNSIPSCVHVVMNSTTIARIITSDHHRSTVIVHLSCSTSTAMFK